MFKRAQGLIGAVAFTLGVAQPAWATVQIVPPGDDVAGQSQLFWAQAWWQWALGVPTPNNPLSDTTGVDARVNKNGPVFFLAGSLTSGVYARTITVPVGKPIFFPVSNSFYVPIGQDGTENPEPCSAPLTLTCALRQVTTPQDRASNMAVEVHGVSLDNAQISQLRQTSTSYFSVALPQDNVLLEAYGVPVQPCCLDLPTWVQDGYYIALDGLSVGTHVLQFQSETPGFSLDVTDTLNVVVPEPSTWAMMLVGFASLAFAAYRTRMARRPPISI
jgi:hypothetical protein